MTTDILSQAKGGKGSTVALDERYVFMSKDRSGFLSRGYDYSKFTLPYVLTTDRGSGASNQHGYQGIGAQLVNHLGNKLVTNMFPIGRSFFKTEFDAITKQLLREAKYDPVALSELLVEAEDKVSLYQSEIEARVAYVEAAKNLIVAGNVCVYAPENGTLQAIKLDRYCVSRDLSGRVLELMTLEEKAFSTLSDELKLSLKSRKNKKEIKPDDDVKLYTWVFRVEEGLFAVAQTVDNIQVADIQYITQAKMPWFPLRWNSTHGESYGRGHVEDYSGDFYVVEFLSEAIAKGMALMADVKYIIKPGSVTDIDEISTAPTGEWIFGNLEDIGVLQLEKYADFTPISAVLNEYKRRLGQAFLLNSAQRRDAERVTVAELRLDAMEMEVSLGGNHTALSTSWASPMARLFLDRVKFPFPEGVVPVITSGIEAYGRAGDMDKLAQFSEAMMIPAQWPEPVQRDVHWDRFSRMVAANLSMKLDFMMTIEEKEEREEKEKAALEAQQVNEAAIGAAGEAAPDIIKSEMQGGQ